MGDKEELESRKGALVVVAHCYRAKLWRRDLSALSAPPPPKNFV